ncbi:MAG: DUF4838 domain-containing protein [Victivallales bacterium]|nr:DUF4838 domain-containing protein [Victivallales bacterium]
MQIVKDAAPRSLIIVPEKAPDSVVYAAKELQTYLKKISGADLPIVNSVPENHDKILIYVGSNEALKAKGLSLAGLNYDGFEIVSGKNFLALFGRDYNGPLVFGSPHPQGRAYSYSGKFKISRFGETGTLFAVYHFLERFCGVRWYMPGELGEIVPASKTVAIPENINIRISPDFEYRFLYSCDFPYDDDSVLWYRRAGFGAPFPVGINHSFLIFKKYRKTHPEYFALINGKRDFNISCAGDGNLCLSNPEVLKCFVKEAEDFFDRNPQQYIFPVMPNDSFAKICECPECQKQLDGKAGYSGSFSDYVWNFVNNVAKEVYKTHPDKFIGCAAYGPYLNSPAKLEKLNPNVVLMICKARAGYWDEAAKKQNRELIEKWNKKIKAGNLYCWEYYNQTCLSLYMRNVPIVFPHNIAEDLKYLKGKSRGEFIEAETWPLLGTIAKDKKNYFRGLTHLNYYVTAKLMWNADTDVNQLLNEYYSEFYGPAASEMKKFWEKAEALWNRNIPDRANALYRKLYTKPEVEGLMSGLNNARAKTRNGSPEQKRIDLIISELKPLYARVNNARCTGKPSYLCRYSSAAPKIDGNPDDPCWKDATSVEFVSRTGETVPHGTSKVAACFDDKNLYFLFTNSAPDADIAGIKALCRERDSSLKPYIWEDDGIEIFLNPSPGAEKNYYQFIINAGNIVWDGHNSKEFEKDPSVWNSGIESAVKQHPNSWTLEVRIPLHDLGIDLKNSDAVTMTGNFIRNRPEGKAVNHSCWSPTMTVNNHNTAQFGTVILRKKLTAEINTENIYSLKNTDYPQDFIKAYEGFIEAKAGDNDSYSKTAAAFGNIPENSAAKLNSLVLESFCRFLSFNIDRAMPAAEMALKTAIKKYPGDIVLEALNRADRSPELKPFAAREKLLSSIPVIEQETFELSRKLTDKRNFKFHDIALTGDWKKTALILAVLLDKTAPSVGLADEKICQAVCISNLRQLGTRLFLYTQDHGGLLPPCYDRADKLTWMGKLLKHQKISWIECGTVFNCPLKKSYGRNIFANSKKAIESGKILLLADSVHYLPGNYPANPTGGAAYQIQAPFEHSGIGTVDRHRHLGGANILFSDGSAEWLSSKQISTNPVDPLWRN